MTVGTKMGLIDAVKFYGSVASTTGIDEASKRKANKIITRLLDALDADMDKLIAAASGIQLAEDEED